MRGLNQGERMFDKTDKPAWRFLNCLLIVTEHNKIRRHRTLDLVVDYGPFLTKDNDFYRAKFFNQNPANFF
jgi:hypothetical protein